MEVLLGTLRGTVEQLRGVTAEGLRVGAVRNASDRQIAEALRVAGEASRLIEAVLIESTGEVIRRSRTPERDRRLTTRMGCHDVSELVQRLTRFASASASRLQRAANAVLVEHRLDAQPLPARLPAMREALIDGEVGLDGLLAVATPLAAMGDRVSRDDLLAADEVLAAEARGHGPDVAPPPCADLLRVQAQVWAVMLDQDGAEPREERALRLRGLRLGRAREGVVPVSGHLTCEVAEQLQRIGDATESPRAARSDRVRFTADSAGESAVEEGPNDDPFLPDPRTHAQRLHDALAIALTVAASSQLLPTVGGAAPTLVISVRQEDLAADTGWAHLAGSQEPVSLAAARHVACGGVVQRVVLGDNGRIVRIGTEERVFNKHQRRAIALRDGNCVIPGCGVPAGWCEVHHVVDQGRSHPHSQRRSPLLDPPSVHRSRGLEDPDEPGSAGGAGAAVVRPRHAMATRHDLADATARHRAPAHMNRVLL